MLSEDSGICQISHFVKNSIFKSLAFRWWLYIYVNNIEMSTFLISFQTLESLVS